MGIYDRDYMKRPPGEDRDGGGSYVHEGRAEEALADFLQRHRRTFRLVGAMIVFLFAITLIAVVLHKHS